MWAQQIFLAAIGLSAGVAVSGGLFSLIVELGVIADFADRTHTGDKVLFYEDCTAAGGILGNIIYVFHIGIPAGVWGLGIFGIFAGIFVGCWSMALAEILNVFPVFYCFTLLVLLPSPKEKQTCAQPFSHCQTDDKC